MAITFRRGKPESPSEWTNRLTRNKSPSEPMSAPVFNTKRTVDCTFQSKKQIANLVCDICLVFRNFMIAFNLGMDLNIFIFFKTLWEIVLLPSGLFLYVDFWGVGGVYKRMFEFLFACNAMQYEHYKKSKSALFVWYLMLLLFVSICK